MKKHEVRGWIEETGIIAAVRVYSEEDALFAAETVAGNGIPVVEITLTVPHATKVISQLHEEHSRYRRGGGRGDERGSRTSVSRCGSPVFDQRWTSSSGDRVR